MNATPLTLLLTAGALAATAALALDLPDPTRPPYATNAPMPGNAGLPTATGTGMGMGVGVGVVTGSSLAAPAGATNAAGSRPATPRATRLSAVLMADAPGRDAAVIDGVVRHVGDRLGDGTVASISPDGVTLKAPGHTTRLRLFDREPDPVELAAALAPSAAPGKGRSAVTRPTVSTPDGASDPAKEQP
jgi:hypothetical protein